MKTYTYLSDIINDITQMVNHKNLVSNYLNRIAEQRQHSLLFYGQYFQPLLKPHQYILLKKAFSW